MKKAHTSPSTCTPWSTCTTSTSYRSSPREPARAQRSSAASPRACPRKVLPTAAKNSSPPRRWADDRRRPVGHAALALGHSDGVRGVLSDRRRLGGARVRRNCRPDALGGRVGGVLWRAEV